MNESKNDSIERHVVLITPDVPWNTGNIGRTCLGAGAFLHLIKPLGFSLGNRDLKRAGLDYWHKIQLNVWNDFNDFLNTIKPNQDEIALFSKNGSKPFWSVQPAKRFFLIFGSETRGLPESILSMYRQSVYYIPIKKDIRCLNLSTTVGIALYESLRHQLFHNKEIGSENIPDPIL